MRWIVLLVAMLVLAGCSDSHDSTTADTSAPNETTAAPRAYTKLIAQLPPFDEPPSDEVTAYRIATLEARTAQCAPGGGGADKAAFLRANREVLVLAGTVRGAQLVSQVAVPHQDGNGCPAGLGPPTYFTTDRTYRLPTRLTATDVFAHYERVLHYGWLETSGTAPCVRNFAQAAAFIEVDACHGGLRLEALGRAPVVTPSAGRLPPRPFGLKYPAAADQSSPSAPTDEVASGETCERGVGVDVPSIILPPPPGIRAEQRDGTVVVEWSFERVLGDCPPTRIVLSVESPSPDVPPYTARIDVRERSGTAELRVPDSFREASVLRAATESVDGPRSRVVTVLIRRPT
jgi:hypothetical protein